MAESTLSPDLDEIRSSVARFMGHPSRTYASLNSQEQADIDEAVDRGLRQFYTPDPLDGETKAHEWSFMQPYTTLDLTVPYATGTVEVASGVVTLTGGTFPSWAASGVFSVSGSDYAVDTRDGNTQITLVDTSLTVAAGTSYGLYQNRYTLPDNYGGMCGPITYGFGTNWTEIKIVDDVSIRMAEQEQGWPKTRPTFASITPTDPTYTTGQRFSLHVWPLPDAAYRLTYRYTILLDNLTTTNKYPPGGLLHGETILLSCLSVAEEILDSPSRQYRDRFMRRLRASVLLDRQANAVEYFGYNGDASDLARNEFTRTATGYVRVGGVLY